jgi:hypothetical protein
LFSATAALVAALLCFVIAEGPAVHEKGACAVTSCDPSRELSHFAHYWGVSFLGLMTIFLGLALFTFVRNRRH